MERLARRACLKDFVARRYALRLDRAAIGALARNTDVGQVPKEVLRVAAIAKQAGVGVGTLYRHFPKRIDVVEAVYRDDVDQLVGLADHGLVELGPWAALEGWLQAYVAYGRAKRTFLNELHEAFEKNPGLKSASRERIFAACNRVLARAQEAGQARSDIDGTDLMQLVSPMCMNSTLTVEQGERLLGMVLDGLRPSGRQPAEP